MSTTAITNTVPPRMKDYYDIRIKESKFKVSDGGKGNPMFEWECEIVRPTLKTFDGDDYDLTSLKPKYYVVASKKTLKDANEALEKLGLQTFPETIDTDDKDGTLKAMAESHKNLIFGAILDSMEKKQTKPDGKGGWEPIYYPGTQKQVTTGWEIVAQVREILCKSEVQNDKPY